MYLEDLTKRQPLFRAEQSLERNLKRGMTLVVALVVGLGGLAATLPMASAVVAPGEVTVESHIKRIGHPTGGVIADVLVKDGDRVRAGQILMRLDSTVTGADATMTGESVDQLRARQARLSAERDGLSVIAFPRELTSRRGDPQIARLMREEERNFALRRQALDGQAAELSERVRQSDAEISGYGVQAQAANDQGKLIDEELVAARDLWQKHYSTLSRLNTLERSAVSLRSDEAAAQTSASQARAKIAEIREQAISLRQDFRSQAGTDLSDVQAKLSELLQRKVAADDTNARNVLRAPQAGVVDKLAYTTIGGVIPANETIMEIVPDTDRMVVSATVKPSDIDQVREGETASLRFSAFNTRTTPQIYGKVDRVAADRTTDQKTGAAFYSVQVTIAPAELRRLGELKLKPGMPVETFIQTGERTMLGYVVKPLRDQLERAFRQN